MRALDGVSFDVAEGEILGLLGPNGAGKTTLVKILLGGLKPKSGTVRILEKNPSDIQIKSKIGFVPERVNLPSDWSALQFMDYIGFLCCFSRHDARRKSLDLLKWMDLQEKAKDPIKSLSMGMKQRLLIAQSLINDPELLIYDEPTSNLDEQTEREIMGLLQQIHRQRHITILMVTHSTELVRYGTSSLRMAEGEVEREPVPHS